MESNQLGPIVILPDFVLPTKSQVFVKTCGIDSLDRCLNRQHFLNYPHNIDYQYNSRGFRDAEWPESMEELKNAIWCIGDSFTVGVGSPYNFTWPQVLSAATGRRCINIGMDGASNTWISRRACQIIQEVKPSHMVVLWSYLHRRESPDTKMSDDLRIIFNDKNSSPDDDLTDFIDCYEKLNTYSTDTNIFNGAIPHFGAPDVSIEINHMIQSWNNIKDSSWPSEPPYTKVEFELLPDYIKNDIHTHAPDMLMYYETNTNLKKIIRNNQLLCLKNLDWARDYHHFDITTSNFFVEQIVKNLSID